MHYYQLYLINHNYYNYKFFFQIILPFFFFFFIHKNIYLPIHFRKGVPHKRIVTFGGSLESKIIIYRTIISCTKCILWNFESWNGKCKYHFAGLIIQTTPLMDEMSISFKDWAFCDVIGIFVHKRLFFLLSTKVHSPLCAWNERNSVYKNDMQKN